MKSLKRQAEELEEKVLTLDVAWLKSIVEPSADILPIGISPYIQDIRNAVPPLIALQQARARGENIWDDRPLALGRQGPDANGIISPACFAMLSVYYAINGVLEYIDEEQVSHFRPAVVKRLRETADRIYSLLEKKEMLGEISDVPWHEMSELPYATNPHAENRDMQEEIHEQSVEEMPAFPSSKRPVSSDGNYTVKFDPNAPKPRGRRRGK